MTWISCKERLPEEFEECLVSDGKNVSAGYWGWTEDWFDRPKKSKCVAPKEFYKKDIYVSWNCLGHSLKRNHEQEYLVTHWMPFPKAPKKNMNPFPDKQKLVD